MKNLQLSNLVTIDGLNYLEGLSKNTSINNLKLIFAKVADMNLNKPVNLIPNSNSSVQNLSLHFAVYGTKNNPLNSKTWFDFLNIFSKL